MIGFLGGTGPEGRSLALRLAMVGEEVAIGSRDAERAREMAQKVEARGESIRVVGGENTEIVGMSDVIFITVPYEGQAALLGALAPSLAGKLIVDTVAPVSFQDGKIRAFDVPKGSAAEEAQSLLPNSQVVAAFQNVSAEELQDPAVDMEGDVVVCSDHADAKKLVMGLADKIPSLRGVDGGALANAKYVEQITPLLVNINRIYRTHSGVKITGV